LWREKSFAGRSSIWLLEAHTMSLQDEQSTVFEKLAIALIEATPEWWTFAELELVAPAEGLGGGLEHSITNSENPSDVVVPTDEIFEATRLLELTSLKDDDTWKRCVFQVRQEDDTWRFTADFER
jgi:hypothetical protein